MTTPLVSILTPSFNHGRYIRDTIESVLGQTYPAIELVIADGGSSDATVSILEEYGDRVTYRSEPDGGFADGLNRAMRMAKGEIIGWLNSDDFYVRKNSVEMGVSALLRGADVAYGHAVYVDEAKRVLKVSVRPRFSSARLRRFDFISQPATFFRRDVTPALLADTTLGCAIDYALWLDLDRRGAVFRRVDTILAAMRYHKAAKSAAHRPDMWLETKRLQGGRRLLRPVAVADIALMCGLKLRGLGEFLQLESVVKSSPVALTLPPQASRALYQSGVLGPAETRLLFLRELLYASRRAGFDE